MPFDRPIREARLAMKLIASEDMPSLAWKRWRSVSTDRRRVGLAPEVENVLPNARKETQLADVTIGEAAKAACEKACRGNF
jgi:hypothetical protein